MDAFSGLSIRLLRFFVDRITVSAIHEYRLSRAGIRGARRLLKCCAANGSILVAASKQLEVRTAQVLELECAPGEIRTPDPQVRSLMLYPTELRARQPDLTEI